MSFFFWRKVRATIYAILGLWLSLAASVATAAITVGFSPTSASGSESITSVPIKVTLSAASSSTVTVKYSAKTGTATSNDFTLAAGTLTFAPGEVSKYITATINNDALVEANESFTVTLNTPLPSPGTVLDNNTKTFTYTILNDDPPSVSFQTTSSSGNEGNGGGTTTIPIVVKLSAPLNNWVSVQLIASASGTATASGNYQDYTLNTGDANNWVYFSPGTLTVTVYLGIIGDAIDENNETVVLNLENLSNASPGTTNTTYTHTIKNDDLPPKVGFSSPTSVIMENGGAVNIPVTLSAVSGKVVTVPFTKGGTAGYPGDYTLEVNGFATSSLTFNPGVMTQNITVKAISDGIVEATETINLTLSTPQNASLDTQKTTHRVDLYDSISPTVDAAEIASQSIWYCGQNPMAGGCTVSADGSFKQAGDSSIHIQASATQTTNSAFWTGFPVTPNLNWNVSPYQYIDFWLHVEPVDNSSLSFKDSVLRIGTGSPDANVYYEFKPTQGYDIFASAVRPLSKEWIFYRVPLAGNAAWLRSTGTGGAPNLADVDYIEFRVIQPSGEGFNAWVDGIRFSKAGMQPPTPQPPPGVDKDAIESKVLVVSFNPILDNPMPPGYTVPPRVNEYINNQLQAPVLEDPVTLAQRFVNTNFEASKDNQGSAKARYKIADILMMDAWPVFTKGVAVESQSNDENFLTQHCPPGHIAGDCYLMNDQATELKRATRMLGLGERAMSGEIDEVRWTEYQPAPGENAMFGEGAFLGVIAPPPYSTSTRAVPNTVITCLHCQSHRIEATQKKMFGSALNADDVLSPPGSINPAWDRFTMIDKKIDWTGTPKWIGALGYTHYPVNALGNYDYRNSSNTVHTNADDWQMYPAMTCNPNDYNPSGAWRLVNCSEWNCEEQGAYTAPNGELRIRGYHTWSLEHLPHATGINSGVTCGDCFPLDKGLLNNWWRYLMDVDQFKWRDGRFNDDWTPPTVNINALELLIKRDSVYDQWVPRPPVQGAPAPMPTRVHGHVGVKVQVTDENPIYRVDLYVDGQYKFTDTIRPYTFDWDATGLSGTHTLVAKAYDMPNGFEGVSNPITVTVDTVSSGYTPAIMVYNVPTSTFVNNGGTVTTSIEPAPGGHPVHLWVYGVYQSQTITYSAQNLPNGASLNAATGEFIWTPVTGDYGAQWIRFIATNPSGDSSALDVVIAVADPNAAVPP